ncbi:MAG: nucleotidyltransferase domain-containing protein [Actinobacteria bacterium]|nr:nucleotidyltransferase domain-containing protein [Actinomycetota bacterium]
MAPMSIEVDADQLNALCRRYGVSALFLFGSVARGDDRPGSDLDLLYDTAPGARLGWEITDFADELSALFGRPVGLVSRQAINPRLRENSARRETALCGVISS